MEKTITQKGRALPVKRRPDKPGPIRMGNRASNSNTPRYGIIFVVNGDLRLLNYMGSTPAEEEPD